jgi:DnaJ-class molecular chaperone
MEEEKLVTCPNCQMGQVKIHDSNSALFNTTSCRYCKGKGKVTKEKGFEIDKLL